MPKLIKVRKHDYSDVSVHLGDATDIIAQYVDEIHGSDKAIAFGDRADAMLIRELSKLAKRFGVSL